MESAIGFGVSDAPHYIGKVLVARSQRGSLAVPVLLPLPQAAGELEQLLVEARDHVLNTHITLSPHIAVKSKLYLEMAYYLVQHIIRPW